MRLSRFVWVAALVLLAACTDSHRPVYSGHEESTEGVPGFSKGKKTSPYVKLGQSYSVDGEEYVPRNQPDYVEEGMASWYGPGFHGGKTANGEKFDSNALTGAHRTLPLPSIVKVTMLSNGKQVYVRINDRGPFAHSRIIDLSRGAAEKIGLLRAGVAKVRIEYMPKESQRFADLLSQGREPDSIDLASEVIQYSNDNPELARADTRANLADNADNSSHGGSFWDRFGSSPANAAEPTPDAAIEALKEPISTETNDAAPVTSISSQDLAAPKGPAASAPAKPFAVVKAAPQPAPAVAANQPLPENTGDESPFAMLDSGAGGQADKPIQTASITPSPAPAAATSAVAGGSYVQLGAFSNEGNAQRLLSKYKEYGELKIVTKTNAEGHTLYHVRSGPYSTTDASQAMRDKLNAAGADAHIVRE